MCRQEQLFPGFAHYHEDKHGHGGIAPQFYFGHYVEVSDCVTDEEVLHSAKEEKNSTVQYSTVQ